MLQHFSRKHQRAERRRAGQVVPGPVAERVDAWDCLLLVGVHGGNIAACAYIWEAETVSGQPFIEGPDAACTAAGRLGAHKGLDLRWAGSEEEPLEDGEARPSYFRAKVRCPSGVGRGAWHGAKMRQPSFSSTRRRSPMGRERPWQGNGEAISADEGAVPRGRCSLGRRRS